MATEQARTEVDGGARTFWAVRLATGALIGLVIGTATSFAQAQLNGPWQALSNSASPWLLGAFAAGAIQLRRGWAVWVGLGACVLEVVAYDVVTSVRGYSASQTGILFWSACAVIGGPIFGWAGWAWLRAKPVLGPVGGAFLPATFIAEAIGTYQLRLHYGGDVVLYSSIGLVVFAVVAITTRRPARALLATAGFTIIGIAIYWLTLDAVAGATFGA